MLLVEPNQEQKLQIERSCNEDGTTTQRHIDTIQTWLLQQPHLPNTWDEQGILFFLRGSNFSLEKCKRRLEMYFTMRTAIPEFFTKRDITRSELRQVITQTHLVCMPLLTPDAMRVNIAAIATPDLDISMSDFFKVVTMIADVRLKEDKFGASGDIYILDALGPLAKLFVKTSPLLLRKFLVCSQEAFPVKIKQVHIINTNAFVDFVVNLLKPVLKPKVRDRIYVHRDVAELYDHVPRYVLPEEYGGTGGRLEEVKQTWVRKCEEYGSWFAEQEAVKASPTTRNPTWCEEVEMQGSFRQLDID